MNLLLGFRQSLFEKGKIVWENGIKTVYDIYTISDLYLLNVNFRHLGFTQTRGFYLELSLQYLYDG